MPWCSPEVFGWDFVLPIIGLSFGCRVGDTLEPRPSSEVSWSVVDFVDTFLTAVVLSVFDVCTLLLLLLFLKLKEGGLGLVGEGVASSVGTEGGGTSSATCLGRGRVDGRGMGRGRGIITFFWTRVLSSALFFAKLSALRCFEQSLTIRAPLFCH